MIPGQSVFGDAPQQWLTLQLFVRPTSGQVAKTIESVDVVRAIAEVLGCEIEAAGAYLGVGRPPEVPPGAPSIVVRRDGFARIARRTSEFPGTSQAQAGVWQSNPGAER